ncbi:uncharacterized protein LOC111396256 isoform X1 [Olea europaea var. sylvestris]|uniref:uncharacterized protein LOC111396256 isoform X1 n=1 Tax=Olea europaea var. sylvestris TaxID=158386 RepID=UPI000C1D0471|nr:uncharacterized protein LOC111396256 isoform X1 [Olea europaea var. sylvestris]
MAASSPVKSNSSVASPDVTALPHSSGINSSRNLRGLNKPKCIKCGNVARSRCPYQSCKNCCAKAQNPCHIHVLKGNSSFPDKSPPSSSPIFDQQSTEASHSGSSHRLRQLSSNFAQFNNLLTPLRSRKPLTRKDAQVTNEWRFLKLKEFRERNIEAEHESFDRYIQNICLLEEVFSVNSPHDEQSVSSTAVENVEMVQGLKLKLRSNPLRNENLRKRIQYIVDQGLKKLRKFEQNDDASEISDPEEVGRMSKKIKSSQEGRALALSDLIDKLNKAQSDEDLKTCQEMASQMISWHSKKHQMGQSDPETSNEQNPENKLSPKKQSVDSPSKGVTLVTIDQEVLCQIDAHFSSLEEVEDI